MDTKTYGGHTVAALRDFIAHSEENGESIDDIMGDCASSAEIIRDLLAALPTDAAGAPIIAWATDDDRVITDRQKQQAIAEGGASASSVKPFSVPLYAAPVAPASVAPLDARAAFEKRLSAEDSFRCADETYVNLQVQAAWVEQLGAREAAPQAAEAVGHFVQRSKFGLWIEIEKPEEGSELLYRFATAPTQRMSDA